MVLVDTSVWVDHFRAGEKLLSHLLQDAEVIRLTRRAQVDVPRLCARTEETRERIEAKFKSQAPNPKQIRNPKFQASNRVSLPMLHRLTEHRTPHRTRTLDAPGVGKPVFRLY
jgi:predicted nucleic acid-binding protein